MPRKNNTGVAGALRLAQTQPVTFSEGLIRTDDNSVLGYVSDLYNTEIDRNGNIRRRKGSVVMNSGKLNEKWYFKESYQIAGVTVLFGLSYKRELWAWIGAWPETDFKVCEKNIYNRFPHYSSGSNRPDYNPWVSFSRGSSFHVLKTDRHMTIVNNLNDAIRIYNRGCFAIAKYNEDVTKTFMKDDIDASRNETDIDLALYVSVKDVTNRIIEPAIVVKSDDKYPLVEGTVEFAAMNEENVPGKFTDPQKIERGSPYFSIFDSVFCKGGAAKIAKRRILEAYPDGESDAVVLVYKDDFGDSYKIEKGAYTQYRDYSSDLRGSFIATAIYDSVNDECWLVFFPDLDPHKNKITNQTRHSFFKITNIQTYFPTNDELDFVRHRNLGDAVICLDGEFKYDTGIAERNIGTFAWNNVSLGYEFTMSQELTNEMWYKIDQKYIDLFRCKTGSCKFIFPGSPDPVVVEKDGIAVFHFTMTIFRQTGQSVNYDLNQVAIEYDSFIFKNDFVIFEHLGYNTWSVADSVLAGSVTHIDTIDANMDASLTYGVEDGVFVDNNNNSAVEFLSKGHRWCVKSGENIVARSQIGIMGRSNIVYEIMMLTDYPENYNSIPSQLPPCFMPVISLHGSSILRYPDPDKNTDVFYDVQYAFNVADVLVVVQDGAIWTGNTNTLKLTYDKAIQGAVLSADRFYSGVLIGTTDGIYFYNNGKLEHCVDGQKITAITIASGTNGAVIVDDTGRLYYAYIMLMESGFYAKVTDIHKDVSDIDFSSAIVKYINGVFYFAMEDQVMGLYIERSEEGTVRRFDRIYNFEGQKIDGITEYEGQPVLWFGTGAVKSEVFEQPYDGGEN